ncbi:hypothetical protein CCACVL1_04303 [Corchorus capsularis]|uniref:Uncharacterized protein n=1 Tax=Corchorus capsularis TaxID=210143 RepID=A0A1R3JTM7_COCAP|nr:hypothetical protein CCACVL1_04303 [Corchorus capsularis]
MSKWNHNLTKVRKLLRGGHLHAGMVEASPKWHCNSEVDRVAYHPSVLKKEFPNGMNVFSLFSGIRGAEVEIALPA